MSLQDEPNPHTLERRYEDRPDHAVYQARLAYFARVRDGKTPKHLFTGVGFHNELLAQFNGRYLNAKKQLKSLQGCKAYGMTVHIVPTLEDDEFYVA